MSEMRSASKDTDFDVRGDMLNDDLACTKFMTINTPNSLLPDELCWCVNDGLNPPCTQLPGGSPSQKAARSRHERGVNASFADGHIQFISNNINPTTWRALGTMNGGEPIGEY